MTRTGQMVNFPLPGDHLEDSGEGGLFVMMVVPQPDGWNHDHCHVDVIADIRLSRPDVCLSEAGRQLWAPWVHRKTDFDKQSAARRLLKEAGRNDLASWALRSRNWDEFSVSMLASVHMGSTCHSLTDRRTSRQWEATPDNLTDDGHRVRLGLRNAYDIDPVLLTFLDT